MDGRRSEDIGYANPEFYRILSEAHEDWTPGWEAKRDLKLWKVLQKDVPITFLVQGLQNSVVHKHIKGLKSPDRIWPSWQMEHLWNEEEK